MGFLWILTQTSQIGNKAMPEDQNVHHTCGYEELNALNLK
jgi:hypothetical protein